MVVAAAAPAHAEAAGGFAAYLRARAAAADGQVELAAHSYAEALAAAPDNEAVAIRALREAMAAGDYALADRAARLLGQAAVAPPDIAFYRFAAALYVRDYDALADALTAIERGPLDFAGPVLRAWQNFDAGQDPFAALDEPGKGPLAGRYAEEHRALLLLASGRTVEGIAALRARLRVEDGDLGLRLAAARILVGRGDMTTARALLPGSDPVVKALREGLSRRFRPDLRSGTVQLYTSIAEELGDAATRPLSILLTRSALRIDPKATRARLLLAQALAEDGASQGAIAALAPIAAKDPFYDFAQEARINIFADSGNNAAALSEARTLAEADRASRDDMQLYGDLLVSDDRYDAAASVYARALARGGEADWVLNLQLGGALEQAGRWPEAQPYLERAVALAPDEPVALNYLGYARIERGERVEESRSMLERASRLSPNDPAITDSLGWAYFQLGEIARAVPLLEKAAQAKPGDMTINEHLGDAYWAQGRRYEARYAWRAAVVYADEADVARISEKLLHGPAARD